MEEPAEPAPRHLRERNEREGLDHRVASTPRPLRRDPFDTLAAAPHLRARRTRTRHSLPDDAGDCPPGLVLGHAHMAEPAIERGVQLLIDVLGATAVAGRA
jgi:hypothetical protein